MIDTELSVAQYLFNNHDTELTSLFKIHAQGGTGAVHALGANSTSSLPARENIQFFAL